MKDKPRGRPIPQGKAHQAGHLGEDDRGNITWQWANDDALQADDEDGRLERLTALADPDLQLAEPDSVPRQPAEPEAGRLNAGYNPYNSGELRKASWKRKKDLRELSSWIHLRKKMARKQGDE